MEMKPLKSDKGVAGLNVLLTVITMLFVIGFLVMIFAIMGGQLTSEMYKSTTVVTGADDQTATVTNETGAYITGTDLLRNCVATFSAVTNTSGSAINSANYTISDCKVTYIGGGTFNNTLWNVTGSYVYDADSTASDSINDTTGSLAGVTDWFSIIIIITVMIVLILLTVIIISTIRGSGLIAGGITNNDSA